MVENGRRPRSPHARPQVRNLELLRPTAALVAQGLTYREMAEELGIAPGAVKSRVVGLLIHLGARDRAHAVARAYATGLLAMPPTARTAPEGTQPVRPVLSPTATTVREYPLPEMLTRVPMPAGAQILHVGAQGSQIVLWAAVCPEGAPVVRTFAVVGTGRELPDHCYRTHVGTVVMRDGEVVWHVFELNAPSTDEPGRRVSNDISGNVTGSAIQIGTIGGAQ